MANPGYNEEKSLVKDEDKVTGLVDSPSSHDDNHEPPLKKQHLTESESNSKSDFDSDTELINHASQDDYHELPLKKQHLTESNSKSDSDTELINHASQDDYHELPLKKQHLTESNSNSKSDSDTELINHGPPNSSPKMGTVAICYYDDDDDDDDDEDEFYAYGNDNNIVKWGPYSWRTADRWNGREVYCIGVDAPTPCNQSISLKFLDMIGCGERFIGYSMEMKSFFFANLNKEEAARMEGLEGVRKVIPRRFCVSDI